MSDETYRSGAEGLPGGEEYVAVEGELPQSDLFSSVEDEDEFLIWIAERISEVKAGRGEKEGQWSTWRRHREIRTDVPVRNYPWPESANTSVPVSNIAANTVVGQLRGTFSLDPFFTAVPHNKRNIEAGHEAESLTNYLKIIGESPFELDIRKKARRINSDAGPMGTCFAKVLWQRSPWAFKTAEGEQAQGVLHDGVAIEPIPLEDAFYDGAIQDVQRCRWFAHRMFMEKYEVMNCGALGVYQNTEILEDWPDALDEDQSRREERMRHGEVELPKDLLELFAVHIAWDVDNDGITEECEFLVHIPTRTILQSKASETGVRTIVPVVYIERMFFIEGMGTCWLSEDMQEEADTIHRMRLNNMHISTLNMFVAKKQRGIKAREKLFPGKVWLLNSAEDVRSLEHGRGDFESLPAEQLAMQYAQRATLASDIQSGFADTTIKTRETMGGQQFRSGKSDQMFASVVETMKERWGEIGQMILFTLVAHREDVIKKEQEIGRMSDEEIAALNKALDVRLSDVPTKFTFTVRSTDIEQTFNQKRQNLLFRVQLESMFHQRLMQAMQIMENPEVPPKMKLLATQMFTSSCRTFEKILEFFDEYETDKYIPEYEQMEMFSELMQRMGDAQYAQMAQQVVQQMQGGGNVGQIGRGAMAPRPRGMGGPAAPGAPARGGGILQGGPAGPGIGAQAMGLPPVPGGGGGGGQRPPG